jgi:hypothetical protein
MNKDIYSFQNIESSYYVFASEGIRGKVKKGVLISPLSDDLDEYFYPLFNLAFGDLVVFEGRWILDDSIRSGNGDMPKVIATVAAIAMDFLDKHPNCSLSFQGYIDQKSVLLGKNQRNILYQRGINSNWEELSDKFRFWGVKAREFEKYTPGYAYDRILVKLK